MLKQKALIDVLGQVNSSEVVGAMLFNKEGLLLAYNGTVDAKCSSNVTSALIASIWNGIERRDLKDTMFILEDGIIAATQVSNMLLAIKATNKADVGLVRTKLAALARYLDEPISMLFREAS